MPTWNRTQRALREHEVKVKSAAILEKLAEKYDPSACPPCVDFFAAHPDIIGACASVGIEHKVSTQVMIGVFLKAYHDRGHPQEEIPSA